MRRALSVVWACATLWGCASEEDRSSRGGAAQQQSTLPEAAAPEVSVVPEVGPESVEGRKRKRMTIRQVRDSMEQISGGVRWGGGSESDWDAYAATLGVADFQTRTTSDLTPSVLFQKFLDDAAVETCRGWMSAVDGGFGDLVDMTATDRVSVSRDVSRLRRHIQGRPAGEEVPIIDDYVELFGSVYRRTESQQTSWETVCVAMFTHPDFFMY